MPQHLICMLTEYAKSGRSMCRGCKTPILSGAIRLGIEPPQAESSEDRGYVITQWFHASKECVGQYRKSKGWWETNCPPSDQIRGLNSLKVKDQSKVRAVVGLLRAEPSSETTAVAESGSNDSRSDDSEGGEDDSHHRSSGEESGDGNENQDDEDSGEDSVDGPKHKNERTRRSEANKAATPKGTAAKRKHSSAAPDENEDHTGSSSTDDAHESGSNNSSDSESDEEKRTENEGEESGPEAASGAGSDDEGHAGSSTKHAPKRKGRTSKSREGAETIREKAAPKRKSEQSRPRAKSKAEKDPSKRRKTDDQDSGTTPSHGSGRRSGAAGGTAANSYSSKALSDEQLVEVRSHIAKYASLTIPMLKLILKKNNQTANRTKMELVYRVAEGKCLGALPKCSTCHRGQLEWDRDSGTYTCPGFFDLSKGGVVKCSFTADTIERSPWEE